MYISYTTVGSKLASLCNLVTTEADISPIHRRQLAENTSRTFIAGSRFRDPINVTRPPARQIYANQTLYDVAEGVTVETNIGFQENRNCC
jgi:hypothetical protein